METTKLKEEIVESPFSVQLEFPGIDIPSYIFKHPNPNNKHVSQYFDATNPTHRFDLAEAELLVKRFAKGLQRLGLQPQDRVLLYSPNQLYSPIVLWGVLAAQCVFTGAAPTASVYGWSYPHL